MNLDLPGDSHRPSHVTQHGTCSSLADDRRVTVRTSRNLPAKRHLACARDQCATARAATPNKITRHTASAGCALGHLSLELNTTERSPTNTPSPSHGSRDCQRSALTSRARRRVGVANSPSPLVLLLLLLATAAAAALSTTPPRAAMPCVRARARARPQFITPRQRGEPQ